MATSLDTFPGLPQTLMERDGYVAGYWLATYAPLDAKIIREQPWQSGNLPAQAATPAQPTPQFYWHRVGIEDGLGGIPSRLTLDRPSDPRGDGSNYEAYQDGYALSHSDPVEAQDEVKATSFDLSGDSTSFWRLQGIRDGLSGSPARTDLPAPGASQGLIRVAPAAPRAGVRVAPGYVVRPAPGYVPKAAAGAGVFVPAPPAPVPVRPGRFPYLELVAELPLIGKIPFDLAVGVRQLGNGSFLASLLNGSVTFRLIGDGPDDRLDGFGLSGPQGPIAQRVAALVAAGTLSPDPRSYGMSAWVGTRTKGAIRLLGLSTLRQLNLA